jgi:hypothetical protein
VRTCRYEHVQPHQVVFVHVSAPELLLKIKLSMMEFWRKALLEPGG